MPPTGKIEWKLDRARSHVGFSVKHMVIASVRGQFRDYSGTLELDAEDFTRSRFAGEIEVASIDTDNGDRDAQLRANDFLAVRKFPRMRFESRTIEARGRGQYRVGGVLTVRGVTRPVALDVSYAGPARDSAGQLVARLRAQGVLYRKDFGLDLGPLLETAGLAIGDKVKLDLDVRAVASDS